MWGLRAPPAAELSVVGLARHACATDVLQQLMPQSLDPHEQCVVCLDSSLMCCGVGGAMARVEGCGCVACPGAMRSWITQQVQAEQKGVGEVQCVGCTATLTQRQLQRFYPAARPNASRSLRRPAVLLTA